MGVPLSCPVLDIPVLPGGTPILCRGTPWKRPGTRDWGNQDWRLEYPLPVLCGRANKLKTLPRTSYAGGKKITRFLIVGLSDLRSCFIRTTPLSGKYWHKCTPCLSPPFNQAWIHYCVPSPPCHPEGLRYQSRGKLRVPFPDSNLCHYFFENSPVPCSSINCRKHLSHHFLISLMSS